MIKDLHQSLSELAGLSARSADAERRIQAQARARMAAVSNRLNELRPSAVADPAAEQEYLELIEEQGRLRRILQS